MRIIEKYKKFEIDTIEIDYAKYIGDFVIRIHFKNGIEKVVDFKPFISNSSHPAIRKYLQKKLFRKFEILNGNLSWNDYDLIFPVSDLFQGRIG